MSENKKYWLFLEPYTKLLLNKKQSILFNTISNEYIEVEEPEILNILNKLNSKEMNGVISIQERVLYSQRFKNFRKQLISKFIGDIMLQSWSKAKPIQIDSLRNVENDIKNNEPNPDIKEINNINSLTFFLNSNKEQETEDNEQFIFCSDNFSYCKEIDINIIKGLVEKLKLSEIDITGENIFLYNEFKELINIINKKPFFKNFHINYSNPQLNSKNIKKINIKNSMIIISVDKKCDEKLLLKTIHLLNNEKSNFSVLFKVESMADVQFSEDLIARFHIVNYSFKPYFNKKNFVFFESNVFITKDEILNIPNSQKELVLKNNINPVFFGHFFISTESYVYASLFNDPVGNLNKSSIYELVNKELFSKKSWRLLRKEVKPCKECIYNLLCPPISNYEFALKKNNLCDVWKE